ncbi:hypothetical protein [Desulforhopalus sp. IMCC35007]|uniref:hypothetical protein n=1 Tax=Desulforhopalus sp. IMCC35007 TaxID=2569543 RepID=UPI0010AEB5AC|nr:hypothetical protein [Desulforhopalus sp. IMCC35007]TKB11150.1 hypothetical protein FCL48_03840 [Desulforhopalus sp. IMCC35007]
MKSIENKLRFSILIVSLIFAVVGGIYFGLFSCGGYVWHKKMFVLSFSVVLVTLFVWPHPKLSRLGIRSSFVAGNVILYFVMQSASSAFYPAAPKSWNEFFDIFIFRLLNGPC